LTADLENTQIGDKLLHCVVFIVAPLTASAVVLFIHRINCVHKLIRLITAQKVLFKRVALGVWVFAAAATYLHGSSSECSQTEAASRTRLGAQARCEGVSTNIIYFQLARICWLTWSAVAMAAGARRKNATAGFPAGGVSGCGGNVFS
jgi:hypothetical protein